ncbi:retention module-containing protein [Shewanella chilikensis]|uniref:retention module-containing protein n=10 Tax=Shewanella chilikensis TaxID=558541 RepID=UPI003B6856DA
MGVAISKQDAVVTNLVGQLKAKDENGNIRDLNIGDVIRNGEEIIFTANDTFTIEYADGTRLTEQNAQPSAQPQPDASAADVAQFANEGVDAEIAALQAQILAGDDPTANLPATAAGAGTAGNQGGFDYISVARDGSEVLASAGYDTSGFEQTAITTQEEILLEDLPLVGPTLDSGTATLSDANLPTGTTPSSTALTQTGNLSFSAAAGVASLTLDGIAIVSDGVFDGPVSINTEYGVLTISAVDLINGNISYSFTLNSAVDHSSSDDFSQAFNLILTDLEGNSVGNTLTISVLDDAPSGQDDINSVDEDSLLAISGNLLDNDVQGADTAQVTAAGSGGNLDNAISNQSQVSGSYGLLTLNADGSYSYQINSTAQAVQALAQGESLTETFSYLLTDADGDTSIQTLTITITGTNDVPVISTPQPGEADGAVREAGQFDDGSIDPGTPSVSGQLSASDVDNGAVLIWSGSADSPLGSFSIDATTGAWNYQLDNAAADGLLEGEIRTETFSVTVTDEFGASAEQLVTITIIGTNDAPILSADSSGSLTEDVDIINGILSDSGALSFTDVDIGDSHVVSSSYNGDASWSGGALDQATQDALAQGFSADNSGWSYEIANSLVQFLAIGETITLSFTLTVTDDFGASDSQQVTLTITGTNDAPVLSIDMSGAVTEDVDVINGMLSDSGDLSFTDVDINDGHSVSSSYNNDVSWTNNPPLDQAIQDALAAGFSVDNSGWNYEIANSLVQFLAVGETITLSFDVSVDDGNGGTDTETVTVTITGTNDAPVLSIDMSGAVTEDVDVINGMLSDSGDLSFTDVDINDGHSVSSSYNNDVSWTNNPPLDQATQDALAAGFSVDNSGWNYEIANSLVQFLAVGETITLSFDVTVDDGNGGTDTETVTVTITGTNDAPVLSIDMSGAVTEDVDVINGMLSDSGDLSFTDVDINDGHSVSSSYNNDVSWTNNPPLDQATQDALAAGFSVDNSGWNYEIANSLVQFLAVGETITLSFDVTVDDGNGGTDTETVTVTITGTNDAPVLSIDMSGAVTEDVDVINGMLSDSGDLSFTDVDINDGHSVSSSYNNDVSWTNNPPLDQAIQDALAAGFSVDNSGWNYEIANSLVQFLAVGETITLSFDVSVDDGNGGTDTETVTVTITGTNDAPVLSIDMSGAVTEDVDVINGMLSDSGDLSFTDVDINDGHSVSSSYNNDVSWTNNPPLDQATQDALAAGFSVDNSGWNYEIANSLVQFLAVGETITLSFDVTVDDGNGGTDTETVTVTITGTNDAPVLSIDMSGAVTEDVDVINGMLSDSGDLSFTDVDINDGHSVGSSYNNDVSWTNNPPLDQATQDALAAGFSVDNSGWNYEIANSLVQFLAVGETITLSFDVTVDDGNGGTDTETVTVTITGTNDAPVLSIDMSGAVTEDVDVINGMLSDSGDLSFTDVDINDGHSVGSSYNNDVSWTNNPPLDQATQDALAAGFSVDNSGWNYEIANSLVQFLAVGETITLSFDVSVDDGNGGTDTETVTVTIIGTNDAPVLTIDMSGAVTEDVDVINGMLSDSGDLSFTDVDINDGHSVGSSYNNDVSWTNNPPLDQATQDALAAGFSVDNSGWNYEIANSLVQFLAVGETITLSFDVTVDDGNGGTDTETVTVTITGTNDAPVLSIDMSGAVTEDVDVINGMLSDSGDLSFTDVDINDGHSVSSSYNNDVSWTNNPPLDQAIQDALAAGFSVDNSGWNYEIANSLVQFLAVGETITLSFDVSVDDGNGGTDTETVTVTITGTNDAPVLSIDMSGAVTEDVDVINGMLSDSGDLSFTDVDINDGHSVGSSYNNDVSWTNNPPLDQATQDALAAGFSVDNSGWNYEIANSLVQFLAVGETITLSFDVSVDDGNGGTDTETVTVTITGTNDAPVLTIDMSGAVTEDVDVINGMLSDSGDLSFTDVDINDGHSVSSSYNNDVSWTNNPPLDQATQDALAAGFSVDNSGWNYEIANSLVQFLAVGETITLSFDVSVDDGNGGTDTETVTVTITGTNDAPVLSIDMSGAVTEDVDVINGMLSDSGDLSFTDVDINDGHSVSSSYNNDVSWTNNPPLDQATQDALAAGFSVDNSGWNYEIANSLVQFLAVGETITLSFDVTVDDGNGGTDTETVTVTITGTNDAPVLSIDMSGAVTEDVDVINGMLSDSGDLSFTDVDINDGHSVGSSYNNDVSWTNNPPLDQATQDALAAGFSVDNSGWNYEIANSLVQFLAVGETITLSFDVSVDDGNGGTDTETVTVTITGTNDAPVLSIDMSGAVTEDVDVINGMLSDSGDLSFTDVDINDGHSVSSSYNNDVSWTNNPPLDQAIQDALAAGFSVDNSGWNYEIANSLVQFLAVGETITLSFDVSVDDGNGGTDTETVTVTITGTNDAPVLSIDMSGAVTEDVDVINGMLSDSGDLSFTDVDINDGHSVGSSYNNDVSWTNNPPLDQATQDALAAGFSVDNSGWNYEIANSLVQFLAAGETITLSFDVSVDDGNGGTDTETVTVTITGTNDAPVLTIDMSGAVTEDVDVINGMLSDSGDLSFTDVDINDGHSVSSSYNNDVSWTNNPPLDQATQDALAAGFSVDNSGWNYEIANSLVQFLAVGETITLSFDVTVDDGNGGTDTETVTVTITGTNDAPVLSIDMSGAVTEDVDVINGMLSDSGDLSFTDVDINDGHSVSSSYNDDATWSNNIPLDPALISALEAGFSVDNSGWNYEIANSLVQFLAAGETITLSFDVTVDDGNGGTDTETVTITINGTNDPVEGEFAKEIWVPASLLQLSDPYLAGYPLNIDVPTDVDATDEISITNLSLEFIDPAETAELGSIWYWDDGEQMLVQYDFDNPEALSAAELGSLVYMPGNNGDIEEQLDISLTFTVNSGTDQVDGDFIIHAVPGNSLGGESVTIGDGSSPLTSGNDQDAILSISGGFADAINLAPSAGSLDLFTDFQKSPFAIPIPGNERDIDTTAGSKRETEVSVRLTINGITFIVLLADPVDNIEQTWFYDADTGLMKASIGYNQIVQESDNSITLADYLTLNPAQAADQWTITYFDNDGGSYQARYVQAVFTHELLPDDAITITGSDDIDNLIFGSTQGDSLTGANQSDEIVGREGNDTIKGLEGDDQLLGGAGNDHIFAGTGADYLVGGPGSDRLDAGSDNDRDILIWDAGSADGSTDEVYNFAPNTDALDLSDILVNEENGVLDDYLDFSFVNGNTIITVDTTGAGGDSVTIVLNGVDLSTEYGTTDEGLIIQSLISDGALLVTQPVVQASLPEPNYTYLSEEQLVP